MSRHVLSSPRRIFSSSSSRGRVKLKKKIRSDTAGCCRHVRETSQRPSFVIQPSDRLSQSGYFFNEKTNGKCNHPQQPMNPVSQSLSTIISFSSKKNFILLFPHFDSCVFKKKKPLWNRDGHHRRDEAGQIDR